MTAGDNGAQFVAVEVGFWTHPQTQLFAAALAEDLLTAGARILRLREHVLLFGSYEGTLVCSAEEIALVCGWPKAHKLLISGLQKARVLKGAKTRWEYLDWPRTRTGYYQAKRAADAARKRAKRESFEPAQGGVSEKNNDPVSADTPRNIQGESVRKKERKESADADGPPDAPQGGDPAGDWEWFKKTYPNPRNYAKCEKVFLELPQATRDRIRQHLDTYIARRSLSKWRPSDLYLRYGEWDEIDAKRHAKKPEENAKTPEQIAEEAEKNERTKRIMERRIALKQICKAQGLRGLKLEERVEEMLEAEINQGVMDAPSMSRRAN